MKCLQPTIGLAVRYDLEAAAHTRTVFRTLALARNAYPGIAALRFVFADDLGTKEGALRAAATLEGAGARIVIGHLSSDAALAAASHYTRSRTLLLLPTATASSLTSGDAPVLRLCAPDRLLAIRLVKHLASAGWRRMRVACEATQHGQHLAADIVAAAAAQRIAVMRDDDASPEAGSVFVGNAHASADYVLQRRRSGCRLPIFLTDDAASASFAERVGEAEEVRIFGFAPAYAVPRGAAFAQCYLRCYGELPGVNALETFAALHVASQLVVGRNLDPQSVGDIHFETPIGRIRFSGRQNQETAHAIWSLRSGRLSVEQVVGSSLSN